MNAPFVHWRESYFAVMAVRQVITDAASTSPSSGFIFARDICTRQAVNIDKILLQHDEEEGKIDSDRNCGNKDTSGMKEQKRCNGNYSPLGPSHLFLLLSVLGPDLCATWPWCQIPFDPQNIWNESVLSL